jgi:hypothetical protein
VVGFALDIKFRPGTVPVVPQVVEFEASVTSPAGCSRACLGNGPKRPDRW